MITTAEDSRRERRFLAMALVASIAVYLIGALFYYRVDDLLNRFEKKLAVFRKQPEKEGVRMSSAIRLDKRPKPVPDAKARSRPPQPRRPPSPPNPQTLPALPAP